MQARHIDTSFTHKANRETTRRKQLHVLLTAKHGNIFIIPVGGKPDNFPVSYLKQAACTSSGAETRPPLELNIYRTKTAKLQSLAEGIPSLQTKQKRWMQAPARSSLSFGASATNVSSSTWAASGGSKPWHTRAHPHTHTCTLTTLTECTDSNGQCNMSSTLQPSVHTCDTWYAVSRKSAVSAQML
jgi:hypothetical protein